MAKSFRITRLSRRAVTLMEVIITGTLFAVVLSMVAQALVVGHRSQSSLAHRIEIQRRASMALDLLVRDAEMGQYANYLTYMLGSAPTAFPTTSTIVDFPNELRIDRMQEGTTIYDSPVPITVGYWRDPSDSTLKRTLYLRGTASILPGTSDPGKILVRDVKAFDVKREVSSTPGLSVFTARLKVGTLAEPVLTQISLEGP